MNYNLLTHEVEGRLAGARFPVVPISSFELILQYGCSERATEQPVGVRILRMNNLQVEGWDLREVKYIDLDDEQRGRWRLEPGDIVFNRTNSKELVGKCEVFEEEGEWVFASYLMRLRVDRAQIDPAFLTAFLNTRAGRNQIDRESRQIIGMSNINAQEIRTLRVPLPKPSYQQELLDSLDRVREERKMLLAKADSILQGVDPLLIESLGFVMPPTVQNPKCWGVRLGETLQERRLDPHRFSPTTSKLRKVIDRGRFKTQPLQRLVEHPVSGDWGVGPEELVADTEYVNCLVIRATEFDTADRLILESHRVRFRYLQRSSYETRSLRASDIVLEKSGGGPLQPVGRVALIEPDQAKTYTLSFSNFVMRLRATDRVIPAYLCAFLGFVNRCGLTESMQAQTNGIRNLKMDEYLSQPIPVPPKAVQKEISDEVTLRRKQAAAFRKSADAVWAEAKRDFEDKLLGGSDNTRRVRR